MEDIIFLTFGSIISGLIGMLIGRKRIGPGWSFMLGFICGIIGWIIPLFFERKDKKHYDNM